MRHKVLYQHFEKMSHLTPGDVIGVRFAKIDPGGRTIPAFAGSKPSSTRHSGVASSEKMGQKCLTMFYQLSLLTKRRGKDPFPQGIC